MRLKIKDNYILRQVAGTWVVVPLGDATVNFNGMMTLNESGVLLWNALSQGCDKESLVDIIRKEYAVEQSVVLSDVEEFLQKLKKVGCLEEVNE